jgi:hypothetical protein
MFLTTKIDGGRAPFSYRRVYEAPLASIPTEGGGPEPRIDVKTEPKPPAT